jgi:hypothetical protein
LHLSNRELDRDTDCKAIVVLLKKRKYKTLKKKEPWAHKGWEKSGTSLQEGPE